MTVFGRLCPIFLLIFSFTHPVFAIRVISVITAYPYLSSPCDSNNFVLVVRNISTVNQTVVVQGGMLPLLGESWPTQYGWFGLSGTTDGKYISRFTLKGPGIGVSVTAAGSPAASSSTGQGGYGWGTISPTTSLPKSESFTLSPDAIAQLESGRFGSGGQGTFSFKIQVQEDIGALMANGHLITLRATACSPTPTYEPAALSNGGVLINANRPF